MKLRGNKKSFGSVLVVTLVLAGILGITIAGYLSWARTQHLLVAQSQAWNTALAHAEAGIEEALAQVNVTFGTNYHPATSASWSYSGGIYGPRTNTLATGSYSVIIIPGAPGPTIISTGYAVVPLIAAPVQRTVQVTTTASSPFGNAMVALDDIVLNGNDIEVDSYDSADSLHSLAGNYYYPLRKAGGDVASTLGVVNLKNANINGKVRTGALGTFNVGPMGFAGDLNFFGPGIQEGYYANDFNAEIKDVQPPDTSGFLTPSGVTGDTNKFVLGSGGYLVNGNLSMNGDTILVTGNATLYINGDLNMSGGSATKPTAINIAPGARLKLYVAGESATFTQINTAGNAGSFSYFGLPSNTSVTWNGNDAFRGTVYAPQANFTCGGGGSTDYDYQGSCVIKSVTLNGHFKFHYDENLKRVGMPTGFVVTSWREL